MNNRLLNLLVAALLISACGVACAGDLEDGIAAHERKNYAVASQIFWKLAARGNATAQYSLALMYSDGQGVIQGHSEAMVWYKLAAAQGHAGAQLNLGLMYDNGQGVLQDYAEAVRWYKLAAAQGKASAQFNLGLMYDIGQGGVQDNAEAVRWYKVAAAQGHAGAQSNLAFMYFLGRGVVRDYVRGHMWANLAIVVGATDGVEVRDLMATKMIPTQIAEAQKLARDCQARKFKDCD